MSKGRICDRCGTTLTLKRNGDDEYGELAAWLTIVVSDDLTWDCCTRACAMELLSDEDIAAVIDAWHATIAGIAHMIRTGEEMDDPDGDDDE